MISSLEQNQQSQNLPVSVNKFKTLFIISLIVLILVIISSIFLLSQNKNSSNNSKTTVTQIPTSSVKQNNDYCEFNGKKYQINESFPLNDVCDNSCICTQDLKITCTGKACISQIISPTKIISPTITATKKTVGWRTYTDKILGFSVDYPAGLDAPTQMPKDYSKPYIIFDIQKISDLNYPLGRDSETATKSKEALQKGEFGPIIGFSNENSRRVVKVSNSINAKDFMILEQFDVCDLQLSRNLIFYINDYQIEISYIYPIFPDNRFKIIPEQYLKNDRENCGQMKIWKNQDDFYNAISTNSLNNSVLQNWYNDFEKIIQTIRLK